MGKYYPYGEDKGTGNPASGWKFATYTRDGSGLDYADQRYYASGLGRFMTADPYKASGGPSDPGSWNRYGYVQADPLNYVDPSGLERIYVGQTYCAIGVGERSQFTLCDYWVDIPDAVYSKEELHPVPCDIDIPEDQTEQTVYAVLLGEATAGGRVGQLSYLPEDQAGHPTGTTRIGYADVVQEAALMVSTMLNRAAANQRSLYEEVNNDKRYRGLNNGGQMIRDHAFGREGSPQCTRAQYLLATMQAVLAGGSIRADLLGWRATVQGGVAIIPKDVAIGAADTNFYTHP